MTDARTPERIELPGGYYLYQILRTDMTCSIHMADGVHIGNMRSEYAGDFAAALSPLAPTEIEGLRLAAEDLLRACIEDFGLDDNDEDDEAVAAGLNDSNNSIEQSAVKFGHMRQLQDAIARLSARPAAAEVTDAPNPARTASEAGSADPQDHWVGWPEPPATIRPASEPRSDVAEQGEA